MIWESSYWKESLLKTATWLEKVKISGDDDVAEKVLVKVEKKIFIEFYAIRKLLDTFKVSDTTKNMLFLFEWYPCIKLVDYMNSHRINELYNIEQDAKQEEYRDITYLCNQFIHSYVFVVVENDDGGIAGFYVSSDKMRNKKLYFVSIKNIVLALRTVGKDYPSRAELHRNPETGQWEGIVE